MPARFVLGPAGSGKTHRFLERLRELERTGKPGCYLVPEQFTYSADRHILDTADLVGLRHVRVLSFSRLAQEVRERAGDIVTRRVDESTRPMLLRVVLDSLTPEELGPLLALRRHVGVLQHLGRFIAEVRNHGPADFLVAIRRASSSGSSGAADGSIPPAVLGKIESLAEVFERYDGLLRSLGLEDPEQVLSGLNVRILEESSIWLGVPVFVDGFLSWTRRERDVLAALAKAGADVEVGLCCDGDLPPDEERQPFRPVMRSLDAVRRAFQDAGVEISEVVGLEGPGPRFADSAALAALERRVYLPGTSGDLADADSRISDDDVAVYEYRDRREEVLGWARLLDRWTRLEGRCRHDQVAVLMRDVDPYRDLIREIFSAFDIPFFLDERRNVLAHPRVRFVLRIFDILTMGWQRDSVVGFLRNPLLGIAADEVDRLENLSRARGLDFEAWHQVSPWDVSAADTELDEVRRRCLIPLREVEARWRQESFRGRTAVDAVRGLLDRLAGGPEEAADVPAVVTGSVEASVEWGARVSETIEQLLDDLSQLWAETEVTPDVFARVFREGILSLRLGVTPARLQQVLVGDVQRSRVEGLSRVIVGGCNERVFPRAVQDDPVLNEFDREALSRLAVELGPGAEEQQEEEAYLFYIAATRASHGVVFTCARSSGDGRDLGPSHLIDEILRILPGVEVQRPEVESAHLRLVDVQTMVELAGWMAHRGDTILDPEGAQPATAWLNDVRELRERVRRPPLIVLPEELRQRLHPGPDLISSVSRLQDFASCAYRNFAQNVLGLVPRPEARVSPLETGLLAHAVLEAFFESPTAAASPAIERRLEAIFSNLERHPDFQAFRVDESSRYRWRSVRQALSRYLLFETKRLAGSPFRVLAREVSFGPESGNPLTVELEGEGRLLVRGRIDRLDAYEAADGSHALVVDYKRTSRSGLPRSLERGLDLQLAAYLLFLAQQTEHRPVGGVYAPVVTSPPLAEHAPSQERFGLRYHGLVVEGEEDAVNGGAAVLPSSRSPQILRNDRELGSLLRIAEFYLGSFAAGLRRGVVRARPLESEAGRLPCANCDFPALCRFRQGRERVRHGVLQDLLPEPEDQGGSVEP